MITTIFFDFDGVLTTDEAGAITMANNYASQTGIIDVEKIQSCFKPYAKSIKLGQKVHADVWEDFCACLQQDIDIDILDFVFKIIPKNEHMFDLVLEYKKKGFKTGLLTANFAERMEVLKTEYNLDQYFDVYAISANAAALKNDRKLFEYALEQAGARPEECIFIDNHEHNLIVAKEMGFHTYYFDHEENDVEQLRSWLIEKCS